MGGWGEMGLAFAAFLVSHAVPARPPVRARLTAILGRRGYLAVYAALSVALLGWVVAAAGGAPRVVLWAWAPWQTWVPNIAVPLACLLGAYGLAVPNPLSFGGRHDAAFDPEAPGIAGVTRHPLLWALALWAGAHAVVNGDLAHVLVFGGFAGFALLGTALLDRRLRRRLGDAEWRRLARRTSLVPFAALASGRWRPGRVPGLRRAVVAVLVWGALLTLHPLVIGVSPLPV